MGILLWGWQGFSTNYPSLGDYYTQGPDGEFALAGTVSTLAEYPWPVGWPFYYLIPSTSFWFAPTPGVTPLPAEVLWAYLGLNILLIGSAIFCLVYCSQKLLPRFSILAIFIVTTLLVAWFKAASLITTYFGYEYSYWIFHAIYFGPIPLAIAIKAVQVLKVDFGRICDQIVYAFLRPSTDFDSADECLAAASKLERAGEWEQAINFYRQAALKWPEQKTYAMNCIASIEENRDT